MMDLDNNKQLKPSTTPDATNANVNAAFNDMTMARDHDSLSPARGHSVNKLQDSQLNTNSQRQQQAILGKQNILQALSFESANGDNNLR